MTFDKQYYIATSESKCLDGFKKIPLTRGVAAFVSETLPVYLSEFATDLKGVAILGEAYSPDDTNLNTLELCSFIDKSAASDVNFFSDLEKLFFPVTGRYVVVAWWQGGFRLYLDAMGTKPAYYCHNKEESVVASHPALLSYLGCSTLDPHRYYGYLGYRNSGGWPIYSLPYDGVRQIPANHYYNFVNGEVCRHWPKVSFLNSFVSLSSTDAAHVFVCRLSSCLASIAKRHKVSFPLTAGFDSRILASCARDDIRKSSRFFTVVSKSNDEKNIPITPKYEADIANLIGETLDIDNEFYYVDDNNCTPLESCHENSSWLMTDETQYRVNGFVEATNGTMFLSGNGPEVFRCFYYPDGRHPNREVLTPEYLAAISGFANNPYAINGMEKWLDELPEELPINLLDLLYWEDRMSSWQSTVTTFREAVMDEVLPCNSRELLCIALSRPVEERKYPHRFVQAVIERAEPRLAGIGFNTGGWRGDLKAMLRARIKHSMSRFPISYRMVDGLQGVVKGVRGK